MAIVEALAFSQELVESRPYLIPITLVLLAYFILQRWNSSWNTKGIPLVGSHSSYYIFPKVRSAVDWFVNGGSILTEGYRKYSDRIFQIPSTDRVLYVLPPQYLAEIKDLPEHVANASRATSDFFMGAWTTLDIDIFGHPTIDTVKTQFIAKIGEQIGPVKYECDNGLEQNFKHYDNWTPISPHPKVLNTVAQMVARAIVGPEVCRNPQWISAVVNYSLGVFHASAILKLTPSVLRPLAWLLMPYTWKIKKERRNIRKIIYPEIRQRQREYAEKPDAFATKEKASIDWLIEKSPQEEATLSMMSHRITGISFGSTHTTSNFVTNCIYDLAAYFGQYAPELREEIDREIPDLNNVTNASLAKLWKLDSFMKESQRLNPTALLSVNRKIESQFSLSDGHVMRPETYISFAGGQMSRSEEYYPHANDFDGFRYYRMRMDPSENHNGLQLTSSYEGSLHFGHGRYMCPGRFMGSAVSKLVLINILQKYDLAVREGEGRPQNLGFADSCFPNPKAEILIRDRQT